MVKQLPDGIASRQLNGGGVIGVMVAKGTGTTHATINTASLVTHSAKDVDGNAFPAAKLFVLAIPTNGLGNVYQGAVPTATQIDIRSGVTVIPYNWFLFVCN